MSKKKKTTNSVSLDDLVCERLSRHALIQIENLTIQSIDIIEDDECKDDGEARPSQTGLRMAVDADSEQLSFIIQGLKIPIPQFSPRQRWLIVTGLVGILYLATNSELLKSLWTLLVALAN